jgi:hypothetical protein
VPREDRYIMSLVENIARRKHTTMEFVREIAALKDRGYNVADLVKAYKRETQRQQLLVKKARICEERLLFVTGTLRELFEDDSFVNLLRAEHLDRDATPTLGIRRVPRSAP